MVMDKLLKLLRDKEFRKFLMSREKREDVKISVDIHQGLEVRYRMGDYSAEESDKLVQLLVKEGLTEESLYKNTVACPYCESIDVQTSYSCPRCDSLDIAKQYIIQHLTCGGNFASEFLTLDKCPCCGAKISSSDELRVTGGLFICKSCGYSFDTPMLKYMCNSCGREFSIREAKVKKIHTYTLKEEADKILDLLFIYKEIAGRLVEKGYEVDIPGEILGTSGVTHYFALVVRDKHGKNYVIDLSGYLDELDIDSIIKDYIRVMDVASSKYIYVVSTNRPEIESFIKNIPTKNAVIVRAGNIEDIIQKIESIIEEEGKQG